MKRRPDGEEEDDRGIPGLVGAAVGAPLSQGREGSIPLEVGGFDLTVPAEEDDVVVRGEPTEPTLHSPTTRQVERQPLATGEVTVEDVDADRVGTRKAR